MARGKRETNGATSVQAARLGLAEAALAATGDAVTIADARGYLLLMNEAAKRMAQVVPTLGLPLARQEPVFDLRHLDGSRVAPRDTPLARALRGEAVDDQPFRIARPDGRDAIVRAFAVPVKDAGGSIIGAATIFRDVTEKETAEDALRVISQRLEATIKERTSSLTLANEALLAEVASLRQTLEVLRASEQRYRALAETARESLFVVNREDVIDYVNAYGAGQLGLHPADVIGRPRRALFPPSIAESQAAHLRQVFNTGNPVYAEEMIPLAGRERWLGTWLAPLKDEAGTIWAVAGFSRDITESRQAEEALRRSEETSRGVLNALPANIAVLDSSGTILAVNEAWRRFARENGAPHQADVSVGMNYLEVCARAAGEQSELAREALVGIHEVLVGERELFVLEYPCDSPTEKHWVILYVTPLSRERGGAVVSHLDITRRKQAEEAVRESEARFRNLVETTSDWVWEVDERCVYSYAGPQLKDILGYEPREVLGRTPFDLMPAEEARRVEGLFNDIVSRHAPFHGLENTNRHKDGHLVVLETSGVPFYDAEGRFRGYRGIDRDITERKRAELQREQVEQMREDFIRTVGHDLRHPLTIILGQAELLKRAQQKAGAVPEALRSLEAITTSARRMAEMLHLLLLFADRLARQQRKPRLPGDKPFANVFAAGHSTGERGSRSSFRLAVVLDLPHDH